MPVFQSAISTEEDRQQGAKNTYDFAVANGHYERDSNGLLGKHDNVRRYWEDRITRRVVRGFVERLVARKRRDLSRIRVLDLGSGSGEGYEILTSLRAGGESFESRQVEVLPTDILGYYKGVDVSASMVTQGQATYSNHPKVHFAVEDLSRGLGSVKSDPPYDIYYSSYGPMSHLQDDELKHLTEEIYHHARGSCIFVADLIGRYSYEWQSLWERPSSAKSNMLQYSMSYLLPAEMRDKVTAEQFPLRYWAGDEFDAFMTKTVTAMGGRIAHRQLTDQSVLVGRHMNTAEYNPHAKPIRTAINSLHAYYRRTDLKSLLFNYTPRPGFAQLNAFFESYQMAWNAVVYATIEALEHWDDEAWFDNPPQEDYPKPVRDSIRTIRNVVRNAQWFRMDDPRANVVEPQLGYLLRDLEMALQRGLGAGHGLLAIYELRKD